MGNTISSSVNEQNNMDSLSSQIDDIAIHYILTQNTIDLLRLTDKEYYDNLIILTSSVIEKKLNNLELGFLDQRILGKKKIVDSIDIIPASNKLKDKVIFNISKFYIKIIMIYSAIATTIDPQYSYDDENGNKKSFYLKDTEAYKHIPKNVRPVLIQLTNPMNLCRKRLSILKNKLDENVDDEYVKLNPGEKLCSMSTTNLLTDEVGIKELDLLYYDIFDYETKTWNKRSKKMKQKYHKDLTLFYQIFTGKKDKPSSIKSFHDIELLDMSTISNCKDKRFSEDILISKRNDLIKEYINKIHLIEDYTKNYRNKLMSLLKELFVIKIKDNETQYTINPDLTLDHVLFIESETRDVILNLYTSCEKYFIQALIIFEKIYDEQSKNMNVERMNYIENIKEPLPENTEKTPVPSFMPTPSTFTPDTYTPETFTPSSVPPLNVTQNTFSPSPSTLAQTTPLFPESETPKSFLSTSIKETTPTPVSSFSYTKPSSNTQTGLAPPGSDASKIIAAESAELPQGLFNTMFGSKTNPPTTTNQGLTNQAPALTSEAPALTSEAPALTSETPALTTQAPILTNETPALTPQAPTITSEIPALTSESPVVRPESEEAKKGIFETLFSSTQTEPKPIIDSTSLKPESEEPKKGIFETLFTSTQSEPKPTIETIKQSDDSKQSNESKPTKGILENMFGPKPTNTELQQDKAVAVAPPQIPIQPLTLDKPNTALLPSNQTTLGVQDTILEQPPSNQTTLGVQDTIVEQPPSNQTTLGVQDTIVEQPPSNQTTLGVQDTIVEQPPSNQTTLGVQDTIVEQPPSNQTTLGFQANTTLPPSNQTTLGVQNTTLGQTIPTAQIPTTTQNRMIPKINKFN
jgi:hypothetical protein